MKKDDSDGAERTVSDKSFHTRSRPGDCNETSHLQLCAEFETAVESSVRLLVVKREFNES